jgi:hypothetical protein
MQEYEGGPAKKFGPEYERAVQQQGSERKAEAKLADRLERVEKLNIRDLDPIGARTFFETVGVRTISFSFDPDRVQQISSIIRTARVGTIRGALHRLRR